MRKDLFLVGVGFLVFVTPFLGVPESWKAIILFTIGAVIMFGGVAYRLASRKLERNEYDSLHAEHEPVLDVGIDIEQ